MDCKEIKAKYGDQLIFLGGVENQKILPFGTAEEVATETKACLDELGRTDTCHAPAILLRPIHWYKTLWPSLRPCSNTADQHAPRGVYHAEECVQ